MREIKKQKPSSLKVRFDKTYKTLDPEKYYNMSISEQRMNQAPQWFREYQIKGDKRWEVQLQLNEEIKNEIKEIKKDIKEMKNPPTMKKRT